MSAPVVYQFAYRRTSVEIAWMDKVVDCRLMPNPFRHGVPDDVLRQRVRNLREFEPTVARGVQLIAQHGVVYIGCLFGRHRSVAVAEEVASRTGARIVSL